MKLFSSLGKDGQSGGNAMSCDERRGIARGEWNAVALACHCPSGSKPVQSMAGAA
jgi:hypothetical protein